MIKIPDTKNLQKKFLNESVDSVQTNQSISTKDISNKTAGPKSGIKHQVQHLSVANANRYFDQEAEGGSEDQQSTNYDNQQHQIYHKERPVVTSDNTKKNQSREPSNTRNLSIANDAQLDVSQRSHQFDYKGFLQNINRLIHSKGISKNLVEIATMFKNLLNENKLLKKYESATLH